MLCVMFYFSNYWKPFDDEEIEGVDGRKGPFGGGGVRIVKKQEIEENKWPQERGNKNTAGRRAFLWREETEC